MNNQQIRLAAKLQIKTANQSIKNAKQNMKTLEDIKDIATKVWTEAKEGKRAGFVTSTIANQALTLAAAEVATLKASEPGRAAAAPVKPAQKASAPIPAVTPKPTPAPLTGFAKVSAAFAKATPATPAATITGTVTAAQFAKPIATMSRAEFNKLTPADKSRFSREGGKLI
jgi:hypothetical protein